VLQIIGHLTLFNVYLPANVYEFYQTIQDLANFDFIPTDTVYQIVLGTDEDNIFENLGLLLIAFLLLILGSLIVLLLGRWQRS
jgi:hypothetical protein